MMKNICIHFSGIDAERCKAGVNLRKTFDDTTPGIGKRIPCIQDGRDRYPCSGLHLPTAEDLANEESKIDALIASYEKVGTLVKTLKAEHRKDDWIGCVECPVCGGQLHIVISNYNGHARGQCETIGCVNFME